MANFPTYEEVIKNVAERALDEYLYQGKSIREWVKIITEQEPCEDAISRQEVVGYLCAHCPDDAECFDDCDDIKNIKALPSVKPQEPKTGHWIYLKNERKSVVQAYKCSVCGWEIDSCRGLMQDTGHRLFCEHCGAKMGVVSE